MTIAPERIPFTVYVPSTGQIIGTGHGWTNSLPPEGATDTDEAILHVASDPNTQAVVAGAVVDRDAGEVAAEAAAMAKRKFDAIVDRERDRRIAETFTFQGVAFQFGPESKARIIAAASNAGFAIGAGALAGDLRWHGGATDFVWIATDNTQVTMDAQTVWLFGQAASAHEQALIYAARTIKDTDPQPVDPLDGALWP